MAGVFADLRVLDLSWGIAGPMTTMFLADNGADVIRIERPSGDPFATQAGYRVWNRGKRSATLDLRSEHGRGQFEELVQTSDVVVDSFSRNNGATRDRPRNAQLPQPRHHHLLYLGVRRTQGPPRSSGL